MSKYIHLFETAAAENTAYTNDTDYLEPWTSMNKETNEVLYNHNTIEIEYDASPAHYHYATSKRVIPFNKSAFISNGDKTVSLANIAEEQYMKIEFDPYGTWDDTTNSQIYSDPTITTGTVIWSSGVNTIITDADYILGSYRYNNGSYNIFVVRLDDTLYIFTPNNNSVIGYRQPAYDEHELINALNNHVWTTHVL